MTYVQAIDRDRARHGRAALLAVLAFHAKAYRHAVAAARVGADPAQAAYDVLAGNPTLGYPGMGPALDRVAAGAFRSGRRRAGQAAGLPLSHPYYDDAGDGLALDSRANPAPKARATLAERVRGLALQAAAYVRDGLRGVVATTTGGAADAAAKVRGWFRKSGTVATEDARPFRAEAIAEAVAVEAVNAGADAGFAGDAGEGLKGYRFDAILDGGTTVICRTCNGVKLPPDHPFWQTTSPRLHWGCRSVRVPLWSAFTPTPNPPVVTPDPGFGRPVVNQFSFEQPQLLTPHAF